MYRHCFGRRARKCLLLQAPLLQMLPPFQLYKADSWTAAHQTKAMSEWIMPCLYHFKVSHMDGSTIISPIVPNSRQTPNISALCDTLETQWYGIRLQTAASKPHGPIPFGFPMPLQPSIPKSSPEGGMSSISHTDSLSTRNKPSISWRWLVGICISYILRTNGLPKPLGHCGIQN